MKRTRELTPLGMQIIVALIQQNITAKELAARIGVTGATITEVLCGKNNRAETRRLIMKELGMGDGEAGLNG